MNGRVSVLRFQKTVSTQLVSFYWVLISLKKLIVVIIHTDIQDSVGLWDSEQ